MGDKVPETLLAGGTVAIPHLPSVMSDKPIDDKTTAAADAIEEVARRSTFAIVTGSGEHKWAGLGTGTLVRWDRGLFILTADHVIGDTRVEDLRFFFPNETTPMPVSRESLFALKGVRASGLRPFTNLNVGRVCRDATLDLAAIPVEQRAIERSSATAFELSDEAVEATPGTSSLVVGFPHDIARVLKKDDSRVVFTQFDWAPVAEPGERPPSFDESQHLLAGYTPAHSAPGADPSGLSGAARWARRGSTPRIWHPNIDIIGVTVTYYRGSQLLKMVRRSVVNEFLRKASRVTALGSPAV